MRGGLGRWVLGVFSTDRTTRSEPLSASASRRTSRSSRCCTTDVEDSSPDAGSKSLAPAIFWLASVMRRAEKGASDSLGVLSSAVNPPNLARTNAMRSRSRSTMSRTAGDWTRPAESPLATFFHNTGEISKPTRRSTIRRDSWALNNCSSMVLVF